MTPSWRQKKKLLPLSWVLSIFVALLYFDSIFLCLRDSAHVSMFMGKQFSGQFGSLALHISRLYWRWLLVRLFHNFMEILERQMLPGRQNDIVCPTPASYYHPQNIVIARKCISHINKILLSLLRTSSPHRLSK